MATIPILFDYGTSPYSQKIHLFCAAAGITIKSCDQPPILPRPTLESLGITYRRIPLLAIGKDTFADSSLILDVLQKNFDSKVATSPSDKAFEVFGDSLFILALRFAPIESLPKAFMKDRETVFPELRRSHHKEQKPSAIAELRANLDIIENQFLGNGKQWIGGDRISIGDINVAWVVRWALFGFGRGMKEEPGLSKEDFPNTYAWIERMPKNEPEEISQEEAVKIITTSPYFVKETSSISPEPLGVSIGDQVGVESADATPGTHLQHGKLVGLSVDTVTLQLKNEVRVHFPRRGSVVLKSSL